MVTAKNADEATASILLLSAEVVAQIKSSTKITSLTDVVLELVKNSLDASASRIEVVVDLGRGGCSVEDDGLGIAPSEFREDGRLCKPYCTSKYQTAVPTHGYGGMFLWSLSALSFLTITSHHHLNCSHNTVTFHQSKPIARYLPAPAPHELSFRNHGTRVTVRDLFGNLPVRVKQRTAIAEEKGEHERHLERLKRDLIGLVLSWPRPVSVVLRSAFDKARILMLRPHGAEHPAANSEFRQGENKTRPSLDLGHTLNILSQGALVSVDSWKSWIPISASTNSVKIRGAISLEPAPTKRVQFVCLGIRPLFVADGYNAIYDEVNHIFRLSSFGATQSDPDINDAEKERRALDRRYKNDGYTGKQIKGVSKGIERWPMFYIRISTNDANGHHYRQRLAPLDNENKLKAIIEVISAMATQWLAEHHFRPRPKRLRKATCTSVSPVTLPSKETPVKDSEGGMLQPKLTEMSNPAIWSSDAHVRASTPSAGGSKQTADSRAGAQETAAIRAHLTPRENDRKVTQPFARWSRIKSGNSEFYSDILGGTKPSRKVCSASGRQGGNMDIDNRDPAKQSDILKERQRTTESFNLTVPSYTVFALDSSSAQLGSFSNKDNALHSEGQSASSPDVAAAGEPALDDSVRWTNPITKERILVNRRTGIVITASTTDRNQPFKNVPVQQRSAVGAYPVRMAARRTGCDSGDEANAWLGGLLHTWSNPIFRPTGRPILQAPLEEASLGTADLLRGQGQRCSHVDVDKAFKEISALSTCKMSRGLLKRAEVVRQVDRKFILVKLGISRCDGPADTFTPPDNELLVLVDQHAADERCQLENLLQELCESPDLSLTPFRSKLGLVSSITTSKLVEAMTFQVSACEGSLFERQATHFAKWGILYDLVPATSGLQSKAAAQKIIVHTLPPGIAERCTADVKILAQLMRCEAWKREEGGRSGKCTLCSVSETERAECSTEREEETRYAWVRKIADCPHGMLEMLNSRSCRSAIMFNDVMSLEECRDLISRLGDCAFPFQCAHGRPSMVPLVNTNILVASQRVFRSSGAQPRKDGDCYSESFRKWRETIE